jgi:5,10-methylenetetrahydromethanopterin reductase
VYAAAGPAVTVVYHAMYGSGPEALDGMPGGPEWRAEIDLLPEHLRHLTIHEDHCVAVTERDRPLLSGDGIVGFTMTGEADALRERLAAVAAAGTTEILYAPMGPDIPRELERFMEMARG